MSNELTLQEAALVWAQGKRVECLMVNQTEYLPISRVGTSDGIISPTCFGERDDDRIRYKFRLAPEPTAKKFRPWTSEEVPVGAIVRTVGVAQPFRWLIVAACSEGITTCGGSTCITHKHQWLTDSCECSTDNGKTWLPCGVEVEA